MPGDWLEDGKFTPIVFYEDEGNGVIAGRWGCSEEGQNFVEVLARKEDADYGDALVAMGHLRQGGDVVAPAVEFLKPMRQENCNSGERVLMEEEEMVI